MNYETLKLALDSGEIIIFKNRSGDYIAIGDAGKDRNGNYRCSGWCDTEKECLETLDSWYGFSETRLKEELLSWTYIRSIPPRHNLVPIGTKVLILDNVEEICKKYNCDFYDEMAGKVCEIKSYNGSDYEIYNEDKSDYLYFPRQAFIVAPQDTDREKWLEEGKKNGWWSEGQVINN